MRRPLVAVPARFAEKTSALRYRAIVNARALVTMVHDAGGEPLSLLPWPDGAELDDRQVAERLAFADAVLLPGGGDIDPSTYGQAVASEHVYDVDPLQDAVDLAIARAALDSDVPVLAVCRGLHVVNVALGGTLEQHMEQPHRQVVHTEHRHTVGRVEDGWPAGLDLPEALPVSCYHHQRIAELAPVLRSLAHADDGTIEAVAMPSRGAWFLGVQWHPEDMTSDPHQQAVVQAFVDAAR